MSSKTLERLRAQFEKLPPEELWAFMDLAQATIQAQIFNLSYLATAKADDDGSCNMQYSCAVYN